MSMAMWAGPVRVRGRLDGETQASTVISLLDCAALRIFEATPEVEIPVAVFTRNPPESQVTDDGEAIVRLSGVPTPEVSFTVEPLPSLKSYRAWMPVATRGGAVIVTFTVAVAVPPAPSETV